MEVASVTDRPKQLIKNVIEDPAQLCIGNCGQSLSGKNITKIDTRRHTQIRLSGATASWQAQLWDLLKGAFVVWFKAKRKPGRIFSKKPNHLLLPCCHIF